MKKKIKEIGKKFLLFVYRIETCFLPVKKQRILFECNVGKNYSGNPRFIYEKMVEKGLDRKYQCYFSMENPIHSIPGMAKTMKRKRFLYFYVCATAGIWISDSRMPAYLKKRKQTTYIQTWHGTPLKKLALDMDEVSMAGEKDIKSYKEKFYKNAQTWDYLISQNPFSTEIFKRAFGFQKEILQIGYPRNDILFTRNKEEEKKRLKKKFRFPEDKKVILYAPTWRDDEFYEDAVYKFSSGLDFSLARKELGGEYIFAVKYHYLVGDRIDWAPYRGFVYSFDHRYDIAELYLAADLLVTDYSSVMFDYSLLNRPIFFYAYDLDKYENQLRGFYFDFLKEAPGPISETTEELIRDILEYHPEKFIERRQAFAAKYNPCDNGYASEKIVNLIEQLTNVKSK